MDPKDSNSHYNSEIYDTGDSHFRAQTLQFYNSGWQMGKLTPPCSYDGVAPLFSCELETPGKESRAVKTQHPGTSKEIKKFPRRIDK